MAPEPSSRRKKLHDLLEDLLGSENVYFQPPPSKQMQYPCIVYKRNKAKTAFANNKPYLYSKAYQIMIIDKSPDSEIPDKVALLPMCEHDRSYPVDNLNHDVFNLFF